MLTPSERSPASRLHHLRHPILAGAAISSPPTWALPSPLSIWIVGGGPTTFSGVETATHGLVRIVTGRDGGCRRSHSYSDCGDDGDGDDDDDNSARRQRNQNQSISSYRPPSFPSFPELLPQKAPRYG